jgi:hypothetical protein
LTENRGFMNRVLPGILFAVLLMTSCGGNPAPPPAKPEPSSAPKVLLEKESVEKEEPLPPEVKIRLRRDGKDNYSWELSGSDADEILRVNEKLKKRLTPEKSP